VLTITSRREILDLYLAIHSHGFTHGDVEIRHVARRLTINTEPDSLPSDSVVPDPSISRCFVRLNESVEMGPSLFRLGETVQVKSSLVLIDWDTATLHSEREQLEQEEMIVAGMLGLEESVFDRARVWFGLEQQGAGEDRGCSRLTPTR